jgi:hypothetical protein
MIPPTDRQQRDWMTQWHSAAIELAQVRQVELASADLARIASDLEDACVASAQARGPAPSSGLIEQQRLLTRGRSP